VGRRPEVRLDVDLRLDVDARLDVDLWLDVDLLLDVDLRLDVAIEGFEQLGEPASDARQRRRDGLDEPCAQVLAIDS